MADTLHELAKSHGFGDHEALLRKYVLPCIGFDLEPSSDVEIGGSRLGGGPDLPKSFDWPTNNDRPLDFLLQVNLAEVAPADSSKLFPSSGLLSFFYDLDEQPWGFDPKDRNGHRVCFFPDISNLQHRPPAHADFALPESALRFWPAQTLPACWSIAGDRLITEMHNSSGENFDWDNRVEEYFDFVHNFFQSFAPTPDAPCHHLGGHSANIQNNMQLEAELVMNGVYCGDDPTSHPRFEELKQTCEDWSLLLQLDSDNSEDEAFMWGDSGMLYYWIRAADLARRDFGETWLGLQCY